jgi:hypothetical protein
MTTQMDLPYWIHEDYFIFKAYFDGLITDYLDIIIKCNKLIFSDYTNFNCAIKITKDINLFDYHHYDGSKFNKPLANSLNQLTHLTQITFGESFNQPLNGSLDQLISLTHLIFGYSFNKPLENSLDKLINLTMIGFGFRFNQELNLPPNIKILSLGCNNQNIVDYIPNSIEQLNFDYDFNLSLDNLPNSIKKISFGKYSGYNKLLYNLPKSLEQLELPPDYDLVIKNRPPNCKIIYS